MGERDVNLREMNKKRLQHMTTLQQLDLLGETLDEMASGGFDDNPNSRWKSAAELPTNDGFNILIPSGPETTRTKCGSDPAITSNYDSVVNSLPNRKLDEIYAAKSQDPSPRQSKLQSFQCYCLCMFK